MSTRRLFLWHAGLATLGLLTGAEALEAFGRLTHKRRYWPGADIGWRAGHNIQVGDFLYADPGGYVRSMRADGIGDAMPIGVALETVQTDKIPVQILCGTGVGTAWLMAVA